MNAIDTSPKMLLGGKTNKQQKAIYKHSLTYPCGRATVTKQIKEIHRQPWSLVRLNSLVKPRPEARNQTDLMAFTASPFLSLFPGGGIMTAELPAGSQPEGRGKQTCRESQRAASHLGRSRCVCTKSSTVTKPHLKRVKSETSIYLPPIYLLTYPSR